MQSSKKNDLPILSMLAVNVSQENDTTDFSFPQSWEKNKKNLAHSFSLLTETSVFLSNFELAVDGSCPLSSDKSLKRKRFFLQKIVSFLEKCRFFLYRRISLTFFLNFFYLFNVGSFREANS